MSQTKKRAVCELSESDMHLPGWTQKQRKDFFDGIKIHGLKKLKKVQRHIRTKTQEEVRIAMEIYKKELRHRQLTNEIERQIEEAGVTNDDYKTWLYFYMASHAHRNDQMPVAALEAFLDQATPRLCPTTELSFPNWRRPEIRDFLATVELGKLVTNKLQHIPTKTRLEITGACDAYTILCDARNHATKNNRRTPNFDELRPGYVYLQCVVANLINNEDMRKLKIPENVDADMARAQYALKEWLMPEVGTLAPGWTEDEKYLLIVAIETYGIFGIQHIHSHFPWKTRNEMKVAITALREEKEHIEENYEKSRCDRYLSLVSWGNTLLQCTKLKDKVAATKRLIHALGELPSPDTHEDFMRIYQQSMTEEEMTKALLHMCMQNVKRKGVILIPILEEFVAESEIKLLTTNDEDEE